MTTEQRHVSFVSDLTLAGLSVLICLPLVILTGCQPKDRFAIPTTQTSPYRERGEVVWAVAPLRNESGTSVVDPMEVADELVNQLHEVRSISVVPLNRTIAAMRTLGMASVDSPAEANRLADALGVDGIVVGTITAWDPYDPPEIGMSLALYGRGEVMQADSWGGYIDPRGLQASPTDYQLTSSSRPGVNEPLSSASAYLDGANHEVQMAVRAFAEGRHQEDTSLRWRVYLASMPLFTRFTCNRLVAQLLDAERLRLAQVTASATVR